LADVASGIHTSSVDLALACLADASDARQGVVDVLALRNDLGHGRPKGVVNCKLLGCAVNIRPAAADVHAGAGCTCTLLYAKLVSWQTHDFLAGHWRSQTWQQFTNPRQCPVTGFAVRLLLLVDDVKHFPLLFSSVSGGISLTGGCTFSSASLFGRAHVA
jgi:hypothetical protein